MLTIGNRSDKFQPVLWLLMLVALIVSRGQAQSIDYVEAKAKLKTYRQQPYLRWIKIYTFDGDHEVYLRHRTKAPVSQGLWFLIDDPGGEINVYDWSSDSVCASAARGQATLQVRRLAGDASTWQLATVKDTFFLEVKPGPDTVQQRIGRLYRQMKDPQRAQIVPIDLLTLKYRPMEPRYIDLEDADNLHDIPPLVRIMAVLMAFTHLAIP